MGPGRRAWTATAAAAILAAMASTGLAAPPADGDPAAALARAEAQARSGDREGAERSLEALLVDHPATPRGWALLGWLRHSRGDMDGALAAHEKAAGFDETRATASYNAACVHALRGRADEAFAWLRRAASAGFRNPGMLVHDADLASLRADARFPALLPTAEENAALFLEKPRVLRVLYGESPGDRFGWVARSAGDCDGDGAQDIVVSAPTRPAGGPGAGRVYVYSGRTGAEICRADGAPGGWFGYAVAAAGDVDGDGRGDVLASAPSPGGGEGSVVVLSGRDGKVLRRYASGRTGDAFGEKLGCPGDVDGDGVPEVLVAAPGAGPDGSGAGSVSLFSGKEGRLLWALVGERAGDRFGSALGASAGSGLVAVGAEEAGEGKKGRGYVYRLGRERPAAPAFTVEAGPTSAGLGKMFAGITGDVDGDGHADVCFTDWEDGARGARTGRALVVSGKDGRRLLDLAGTATGEGFGIGDGPAGDVDRDGRADVVFGSWQSGEGAASAGKATVFSGAGGKTLARWTCNVPGETFGFDAAPLGDLDGDGGIDFVVSAAYSGVSGKNSGRAFVIAGPAPPAKETAAPPADGAGAPR